MTFGTDKEAALLHAVNALETGLSFYLKSDRALPLPSQAKEGESLVMVQSRQAR